MQLSEIFAPDAVMTGVEATSKRQVLKIIVDGLAERYGLDGREVLEAIYAREKLGTTAIGDGVAIPHAKLAGLEKPVGLVACLSEPIGFDALDDEPVDLVVMLLAPESAGADHLRVLAKLSRIARDHHRCAALRGCANADSLWQTLTAEEVRSAA